MISTIPDPDKPRADDRMGVILGTAAYMSPEQARGRAVDKRTDIWAFGAVLYEMLTGARAFDGEDTTETIAAVMKTTTNWSALPADVPAEIVTLIQRCLEKDAKRRIADISIVRFLIDEPAIVAPVASAALAPVTLPSIPIWRRAIPFLVTAILAGAPRWRCRSGTSDRPRLPRPSHDSR